MTVMKINHIFYSLAFTLAQMSGFMAVCDS